MTKEEAYEELIKNLGIVGAPTWDELPPDDNVKKVIEANISSDDDSSD